MAAFLDVCRFTPTLGGTTDWTVSAAVTGYQTPASAGAVNATVYRYRAESADLSQWEIGYGAYTSAGTVLARTTVLFNSSGTTAKINFTATPQVAVVALKEDLLSIEEANSFTDTQKAQAISNLAVPFACGRLSLVSTTALQFLPYNGDLIKINGLVYRIPSGGITGLANTGVFVGGVAAQNLAASTLYYVYAFINSGTVTADFSTTSHAMSTTAGNVGVEIKSGDSTRTFIGMVYTNASSQFQDSNSRRTVASWFNRASKDWQASTSNLSTPNTTSPNDTLMFTGPIVLTWADEATTGYWNAQGQCTTATFSHVGMCYDAVTSNFPGAQYIYLLSNPVPACVGGTSTLSEGAHTMLCAGGSAASASGTLSMNNGFISGSIWA